LPAWGYYTLQTTEEFVEQLRVDQALVESTLHDLVTIRTREWVTFASERLESSGIQLYFGLGNDDFGDLVPCLDTEPVHYAGEGVVPLKGFLLASCGWCNVTPWHTNRELSEQGLAARILR
jgi:Icc-related predicted phosphoesterase